MNKTAVITAILAIGLGAAGTPATAQGNSGNAGKPDRPPAERRNEARKQQGQGQGQARAQEARGNQGRGERGRGVAASARARRGPPDVAQYNRNLLGRAAEARGRRHGDARAVEVRRDGDEVRVVREDGTLLFALDREDAEQLGYWRMALAPRWSPEASARPDRDGDGGIFDGVGEADRETGGSPAFCRSGEGHPVWGREWCVDKGFGLDEAGLWGRGTDLEGVILREPRTERDVLDRGGLIDILGDIVFGRLAVQSLVLGADEPLTGRWLGRADDGPRILRVTAGDVPVAELVDADRDDDVDVLLVNLER